MNTYLILLFKSMLITRLWYEKQTALPQSNWLLGLGFKSEWPQPSLKPRQHWVSVLAAVWALWAWLSGWAISGAGGVIWETFRGHRWLWWGAEEKPSLATVRELTFSKYWVVHATCRYESCWIFCHETTNELDSHHIHQLVEQIYPSLLNLSEWNFTCG